MSVMVTPLMFGQPGWYKYDLIHDDMTSKWSSAVLSDQTSYFATDRANNFFICCRFDGVIYWLERRSGTDGALQASYDLSTPGIGEINPFIIGRNGKIWCFKYNTNQIYVFEADLSTYTLYNINAGAVQGDIYNACGTFSGDYIYVTGPFGGLRNELAKIPTADPTSFAWNVVVGGVAGDAYLPQPGENDNIYMNYYSGGDGLKKMSGVDGSLIWDQPGLLYSGTSYCVETARLYANRRSASDGTQLDPATGNVLGDTTMMLSARYCCQVYNEIRVYFGSGRNSGFTTNLFGFDITNNWGVNEPIFHQWVLGGNQYVYFNGDSTGYIHSQHPSGNGNGGNGGNGDTPIVDQYNEEYVIIGAGELEIDGTNIGFTQGGVRFQYSKQFISPNQDQSTCDVLAKRVKEELFIATAMLEATLENLKIAWGISGTIEAVDGTSILGFGCDNVCDEPEHHLLFVGPGPSCGTRYIEVYKVTAFEAGEVSHKKDAPTMIPVVFKALLDNTKNRGEAYGRIVDDSTLQWSE